MKTYLKFLLLPLFVGASAGPQSADVQKHLVFAHATVIDVTGGTEQAGLHGRYNRRPNHSDGRERRTIGSRKVASRGRDRQVSHSRLVGHARAYFFRQVGAWRPRCHAAAVRRQWNYRRARYGQRARFGLGGARGEIAEGKLLGPGMIVGRADAETDPSRSFQRRYRLLRRKMGGARWTCWCGAAWTSSKFSRTCRATRILPIADEFKKKIITLVGHVPRFDSRFGSVERGPEKF